MVLDGSIMLLSILFDSFLRLNVLWLHFCFMDNNSGEMFGGVMMGQIPLKHWIYGDHTVCSETLTFLNLLFLLQFQENLDELRLTPLSGKGPELFLVWLSAMWMCFCTLFQYVSSAKNKSRANGASNELARSNKLLCLPSWEGASLNNAIPDSESLPALDLKKKKYFLII